MPELSLNGIFDIPALRAQLAQPNRLTHVCCFEQKRKVRQLKPKPQEPHIPQLAGAAEALARDLNRANTPVYAQKGMIPHPDLKGQVITTTVPSGKSRRVVAKRNPMGESYKDNKEPAYEPTKTILNQYRGHVCSIDGHKKQMTYNDVRKEFKRDEKL